MKHTSKIMSYQLTAALSAVLTLALSHSGLAKALTPQQREDHQHTLFSQFDSNGNGKLTEKEFVHQVIADLFKKFDQDNDGKVSKKEYHAHAKDKARAQREYPILDSKSKGFIKLKDVYKHTEFINELKSQFAKLDTQSKGFLTLADLPDVTPNN